jgi:hypothetical protein
MRCAAFTAVGVVAFISVVGGQITTTERQRLLSHLDMTSAWLTDEVESLSPAQLRFRRAPHEWSIAQVLDHLVMVGPIYWEDLQTALKAPPATFETRQTDADILWYGIDRTYREQAIPTEVPTGRTTDLREALATYRQAHDRLRRYVQSTDDDLRAHYVARQGSDAYQWVLLISTHEQRHILQIREIKAAAKFPKR